jgi:hypothetical protein
VRSLLMRPHDGTFSRRIHMCLVCTSVHGRVRSSSIQRVRWMKTPSDKTPCKAVGGMSTECSTSNVVVFDWPHIRRETVVLQR